MQYLFHNIISNMVLMRNPRSGKEYSCSVEAAIDVIGGKWKPVILWHLRAGPLRFTEIRTILPNITPGMLTRQLRELEMDSAITRVVYAEVPPRVEYSLTEFGKTVSPILDLLCDWGRTFLEMNDEEKNRKPGVCLHSLKQKA